MARRKLLEGWRMDPTNRNRMIGPNGERITYHQYRNLAAQQEGLRNYYQKYKIEKEARRSVQKELAKSRESLAKDSKTAGVEKQEKELTKLFTDAAKQIATQGGVDPKTKKALHKKLAKMEEDGLIDSHYAVFHSFMKAQYRKKGK
jgi:hypothetical protein